MKYRKNKRTLTIKLSGEDQIGLWLRYVYGRKKFYVKEPKLDRKFRAFEKRHKISLFTNELERKGSNVKIRFRKHFGVD